MTEKIECLTMNDLTESDLELWTLFQSSDKSLNSPYFSSDYVSAVSKVRDRIHVLRWSRDGKAVGFLPFRQSKYRTALPVGGPMDDLHGLICAPTIKLDLTGPNVRRHLGGYGFSAVPYEQARHGLFGQGGDGNQVIDLSEGFEAWHGARSSINSNFRREWRKAEKLLNRSDVTVVHDVSDPEILKRLIELKSDAYQKSGYFDLFSLDWPGDLLRTLLSSRESQNRAIISTLELEGRPIAISLCLRAPHVLHYWFPAYEPEYRKLKPGLALLFAQARWASEQGMREFHLGLGEMQYKRQFASWMMPVRYGRLDLNLSQKFSGHVRQFSTALEGRHKVSDIPAKLFRKFDRVALAGSIRA